MAWLARSIADSLRIEDNKDEEKDGVDRLEDEQERVRRCDLPAGEDERLEMGSALEEMVLDEFEDEERDRDMEDGDDDPSRGVKEDLTELKQTLTRQFWGVASFLAPPPPPPPPPPLPQLELKSDRNERDFEGKGEALVCKDEEELDLDGVVRLHNGREFQEEAAILDMEAAAPNSDREEAAIVVEEEEDEGEVWDVVGITEEVLTFATNIGMHPETWLDYPIEEEDDPDEFIMTTDQREHTYAVEYLSPRLAALRIELCPAHMSEGYFWKVYFVLLHSRLEKQDAEILSTPQVMAARSLWMKELQKQTQERASIARDTSSFNEHSHSSDDYHLPSYYDSNSGVVSYRTYEHTSTEVVVEKHPIPSTETRVIDETVIIDKPMIEINNKKSEPGPSLKQLIADEEEDEDDWLKDENINTSIPIWEEEEVSFSDLEDDEDLLPLKPKPISTNLDLPRQSS